MKRIGTLYKNAYSGLSPATWWLSLVMLVNRAGTMVVPFLTLYLTDKEHYTIAKAGAVMSVFGLGAICGGILGGKLTDKFGFYNIQLGALFAGGSMFILLGQMHSYLAICICTFFLALLNESFRPANATAIAQYSKEENRTRSYSLNRLSINLGWAFGGALGGFIAARNYHLLFWIDGITNIFAGLLLMILLSPRRNQQTPSIKDKPAAAGSKTGSAYKDGIFMAFIVLTTMYAISFFQIFSTQPVFYKQQLHLTPDFIGLIMAMNGVLIAGLEMAVVFKLEQKGRHIHFITMGTLLCGLSFVIFNLLPGAEWLAIVSTLIVTAGEMLSMPFMNSFWITRTNMTNRGQYAGLYTVAWSVAQVAGPYLGSQVAQRYGYEALWWAVGVSTIMTAAGFKMLQRRHSPITNQ